METKELQLNLQKTGESGVADIGSNFYLVVDRSLHYIQMDDSAMKIFGSQILNQEVSRVNSNAQLKKIILQIFGAESTTAETQASIHCADGKDRTYHFRFLPLYDQQNTLSQILICGEIASRELLKSPLLNQFESTFSHVFDEMIEGIQILDFDLAYLYLNSVAVQQSQRTKEELIGKRFIEVWPGSQKTELYRKMVSCAKKRKSVQFENTFRFLDGSIRVFKLRIHPISDGILINSLDITEEKRTEELRFTNERLFRTLFENLLNGFAYCRMIYEKDVPVDFEYLLVNSSFEKLTGLQDVLHKKVSEIIPGIQESDPKLFEIYGRVARSGVTETFESYIEALQLWFFVTVYSPEKDFFITIFDVITDRKNAEKKLREQVEELQRWYQATLGREERVIELKQEINRLLIEAGRAPRYAESQESG